MNSSYTGINPNINNNNYSRDVALNVSTTSSPDSVANILMNVTYSILEPYKGIIEVNNVENDDLIKVSLSENDFNLLEASIDEETGGNPTLKSLFEKFSS